MEFFDAHCDTLSTGKDLWQNDGHFDLRRAARSGGGQVMAAFGPNKPEQLSRLRAARPPEGYALLAAVEGGDETRSEADIERFVSLDVRLFGLTWNNDNALAGGCGGAGGGLTAWGAEAMERLEDSGVLIDLAHASARTFDDVLDRARRPPVVTHACCDALCAHRRNVTDDQLRRLSNRGGVIGITFYTFFINNTPKASIEELRAHIVHAVRVAGEDAVGLGSDFDGCDLLPEGVKGVESLPGILEGLPFSQTTLEKIAAGNWKRLLV